MTDLSKHFESFTIQKPKKSNAIIHKTSELMSLDWNELKDDDLIEVSHKVFIENQPAFESRSIAFKDLCHAIAVSLMSSGAIPFQGED